MDFTEQMKEWKDYHNKRQQIYQKIKNDFDLTVDKIFGPELQDIIQNVTKLNDYKDLDYATDIEIYNEFMNRLFFDLIQTYKLNIVIPIRFHFPLRLSTLYNNYVDIDKKEQYFVKYNNEFYVLEIIDMQYTGPFNKRYFIEPLKDNINNCAKLCDAESVTDEFYETFVDVMEHYFVELKEK